MSFLDCNASHSNVPYMLDIPDWHALPLFPSSLPYFIAVVCVSSQVSNAPLSDISTSDSTKVGFLYLIERMWQRTFLCCLGLTARHPSSVAVAMAMRSRWDLGSDSSVVTLIDFRGIHMHTGEISNQISLYAVKNLFSLFLLSKPRGLRIF
ncbi:hypothetical protein LXL04_012469 [Taraxacum kok-saghyz]